MIQRIPSVAKVSLDGMAVIPDAICPPYGEPASRNDARYLLASRILSTIVDIGGVSADADTLLSYRDGIPGRPATTPKEFAIAVSGIERCLV